MADTSRNFINWFEIPALDIQRAKLFYETIFDVELAFMDLGDGTKMAVFPGGEQSVSGSIIEHKEWYKPSATEGPLLYLNANPDLKIIQEKVDEAGGSVSIPKRQISPEIGYMAVIIDSEGNRIALQSKN